MTFPAIYGCVSTSRRIITGPPAPGHRYWGVEFNKSSGTIRAYQVQWNFVSGVHTQDLPSSSDIEGDPPSGGTLSDLYSSGSYSQWVSTVRPSGKAKVWGDFGSNVIIQSIGIYTYSLSLYRPTSMRLMWSDDALTWTYSDSFGPSGTENGLAWFATGF